MKFGLSDDQLRQVQTILSKYPSITEAVVFGSRAMGNYKEASDVDVALKGDITLSMVADVKYALEEDTYLPFFFDIIAYGIIDAPKLKEHIDKYGEVLYRAGWKDRKLSEVASLVKETCTPKPGNHLPYIGLEHIQEQGLRLLGIGDSDSVTSQKFCFKPNDVLFGKLRPYFRKVVKPDFAGVCSTDIWVVRAREKNDQDFIFYFFANQEFVDTANSGDSGTRMPRADWDFLKDMSWQFPPLPEQRAIAAVLSSIDAKIDLLHRQNKTLEGMASALWRKMFVDEAGSEWKTTTVGEVSTINEKNIDKDYPFEEIEYLDTGSITEGQITEYQYLQLKDAPSRARRIVQKNDIVVSMVRPIQKHYGILKKVNPNTIVSTGFVVISCRKIDPHFIYVLLTQKEMTEFLDIIAEASTTTYPSLAPSDIEKIDFQMPPAELLEQFSEYAEHVWGKIEGNNSQIRTLSRFRDTLLPKLMSGEVRVAL